MRQFVIFVSLFYLIRTSTLDAQYTHLRFDKYSLSEGLPNLSITGIIQDKFGFIWMGTNNGIIRFDGYHFIQYAFNAHDPTSISSNFVNCLQEADNGDILVGTQGDGFCIFKRDRELFERYRNKQGDPTSLRENTIKSIFKDSRGNIWLATLGGGVCTFDQTKKTFHTFSMYAGNRQILSSNHISSLAEDKHGNIWIAGDGNGITKYNLLLHQFTFLPQYHFDNYFKTIEIDHSGNIWIGTNGSGLYMFHPDSDKVTHFLTQNTTSGLSSNIITAIKEISPGTLAIATDGGGINIMNTHSEKFIQYLCNPMESSSLSSNAVYSICIDHDDNIWFGTFREGINLLRKNKEKFGFFSYSPDPKTGLTHKSVLGLAEMPAGDIAIGTDGGGLNIYRHDTNTFSAFKNEPEKKSSICSNVVKSVFKDSEGNLWVGSFGQGLDRFDPKTEKFTHINSDPSKENYFGQLSVWSIKEDNKKNLWLGTLGKGLIRYSLKTGAVQYFMPDNTPSTISSFQIMCLLYDSHGNLWIGTENNGMDLYVPSTNRFIHFKHSDQNPHSISNNNVRSIFEDTNGKIWIGTDGAGLNLKTGDNTFQVYTEMDGLPSNSISSIIEDKKKNLWIGTTKGISKFNPQNHAFRNYNYNDGLQGDLFNIEAVLKLSTDQLLFGGINGYNHFNPDSIIENSIEPKVMITDFKIFNRSVKVHEMVNKTIILEKSLVLANKINISHLENVIDFEFAALDFTNPKMNRYKYKLEGFDEKWNFTNSAQQNATYTNLPGGDYTFVVYGTNSDGQWSRKSRSIQLHVTPPFYETVLFKIACALLGIILMIVWYRNRILKRERKFQFEKQQAEKEIFALKNDKLQAEVDGKNSKLTSSALLIGHKNQILNSIKTDLEDVVNKIDTTEKRYVYNMIRSIENDITKDESWEQFEIHFNEVHRNFIHRLKEKHSDLTQNNIKMCVYLLLNINTKEIAGIMNISVRGVEKSRYRLRKTLGLDAEADISEYLENL